MNDRRPSIERLAELQQLIADFSKINRVVNYADLGREENDTEHSFGLALTCWFLAPKIAPDLDITQILMYALAHDLVEIHSGDTFIYDHEATKTKPEREAAGIKQLAEDWPDMPDITDYVQGYADKRDSEAKFVYAVDKMLPILLIVIGEKDSQDKETYWQKLKVTREMLAANKESKMRMSPEVSDYFDELMAWLEQFDHFYKTPADNV